jgi:hypothetical protein
MKVLLILIFFSLCGEQISAQSLSDTTYKIEISITVCPLINYFRYERYPGAKKTIVIGEGIFIRSMWHPGRLLSVGLLSGYALISKDRFLVNNNLNYELGEEASARLSAIPLQIVVSMQSKLLEVGLGMGPYLMLTTINFGEPSYGRRFELGITFFSSYSFSLGKNIYIGPELRMLYLSYRGILSVMPSITFRLDALRY